MIAEPGFLSPTYSDQFICCTAVIQRFKNNDDILDSLRNPTTIATLSDYDLDGSKYPDEVVQCFLVRMGMPFNVVFPTL